MILVPNWSPSAKVRGSLKRSFVGSADGQESGRHALRFVSELDLDKGVLALLPRDAPTARRAMLSDWSSVGPLRHRRGCPEVSAVEERIWL
jgi:hypothetical protein